MQLSPLQSRLAASLGASLVIFALYLLLFSPSLASATELPINHAVHIEEPLEASGPLDISYEPDFSAFDRSIIGRAPTGVTAIKSNAPESASLQPGKISCYMIEKSTLSSRDLGTETEDDDDDQTQERRDGDGNSLSRRASAKTVYISANTCSQPSLNTTKSGKTQLAPQLSLYVSTSDDVSCPSSSEELSKMKLVEFDEGAVMYSLNTTGNVYLGIAAPNISSKYTDSYDFEIAVSLDEYYHQYDNQNNSQLLWMDSDSTSVLLVTRNITENESESKKILHEQLPYDIFIQNNKSDTISGLQHSYCGLKKKAEMWGTASGTGKGTNQINMGYTTRGPGGLAKMQFYLEGLNSSSSYAGILVQTRNTTSSSSKSKRASSAGGGGIVFRATSFKTSSATNCKVVTDLEFCTDIQYAVPGNDRKYNSSALAKAYDDYAKEMYANFEKAMMQIPCEVAPQSSYSLARSCDDCKSAYKRWLCTVSVPRCEDFMNSDDSSIYRNVGQAFPNGTKLSEKVRAELGKTPGYNSSRNAWIDQTIQPGPYKELLPCEDICYELVQSCPAALGFGCPQPSNPGFNMSYGRRDPRSRNFTCNYPGEARTQNSPATVPLPSALILGVLPLAMWLGL